MIALRTEADCQYCPFSLICLGDNWTTDIARSASMRACRSCRAVFFNVGHRTYLCTMLYWKRQRQLSSFSFSAHQLRLATTQDCSGTRRDGSRYARDCLELYQDSLEKPTP
jgi:hypothetical protein